MTTTEYYQRMDSALSNIESRLSEEILFGRRGELVEPEEIAATHNYIWTEELEDAGIEERFIGQYRVDRWGFNATRVYASNGKRGCSPLEFKEGVLAYAATMGKDQFIKDVTKLPKAIAEKCGHVSCDPNMEGSELVMIAWSQVPNRLEYFPGILFDGDISEKYAMNSEQIKKARRMWDIVGTLIARKQNPYNPPEGAYLLTPGEAKKRGVKIFSIEEAKAQAEKLHKRIRKAS